ncbi:MAG: GNAT family N-acetyltransferase [Hyphomicrobiales bacterium]
MTVCFDHGNSAPLIDRAHAIRRAVFIEEQHVSEPEEWDDLDQAAIHFIGVDADEDVATGRMMVANGVAKLQRIAVLKHARGRNLGLKLIKTMMDVAEKGNNVHTFKLSAQTYAIPFYERLGFVAFGDEYDDAGIPHRDMKRAV